MIKTYFSTVLFTAFVIFIMGSEHRTGCHFRILAIGSVIQFSSNDREAFISMVVRQYNVKMSKYRYILSKRQWRKVLRHDDPCR